MEVMICNAAYARSTWGNEGRPREVVVAVAYAQYHASLFDDSLVAWKL